MDVDVSEINRFAADLGRLPDRVLPLARAAVQKTCADTKRDAQAFAPVDTGNLRNSITYETHETRDGAWGEVGPTANYGAFVEYGTSRNAPAAFMGPAFDRHAGEFEKAMEAIAAKVQP